MLNLCLCLCVLCGNSVTQPTALPTGKRTDCVANCCGYFALSASSSFSCCLVNSINVCEREQECGHKTSTLPGSLPLPSPSHSMLTRFCVLVVAKVLTFAQICSCSFTCLRYFSLCRRVAAAAALSLRCSSLLVDNYTKTCSICHKA